MSYKTIHQNTNTKIVWVNKRKDCPLNCERCGYMNPQECIRYRRFNIWRETRLSQGSI
jgi:ribosomal protein L44E